MSAGRASPESATKVLLVGGTSHAGKSTLAEALAGELGWRYLSTDMLARHPGRPWRDDGSPLPPDVSDHYASAPGTELMSAVLEHYRHNVWPIVAAIVRSHTNNPYDPCLVLEGSAVLPDLYVAARFERTSAVWLTADADLITSRVRASSRLEKRSAGERRLIEAFLERTLAFDEMLMTSVAASGQASLDACVPGALESLVALCTDAGSPSPPTAFPRQNQ